jgi:thiol-disulfide isomerase/thioredoxin
MATYKAGYKRSGGNDKFLTYVIVGFGAAIVAIILGLIIYNVVVDELEYSSFDSISSYQEVTSQSEQQYLVYYYSESCGACKTIKASVLDYADKLNIKVYFFDAVGATGVNVIRHPDTLEEMQYTPTLLTVKNGVLVDMNVGGTDVVDTLEDIDLGTYNKID